MKVLNASMESNKFYLYRHIRPDTNEVFYIGIGRYQTKWKHVRAYCNNNRNNYWKNIVKLNNGDYISEIIFDGLSELEVKEKEKEFIKLYGRNDLKLGTLCNLTDGGEGTFNLSEESRKKISIKLTGKNNYMFGKSHTPEWKTLMKKRMSGVNNPNYNKKIPDWHKEINRKTQLGRIQSKDTIEKRCAKLRKPIIDLNTNTIYNSISEIAKAYNVSNATIPRWVNKNKNNIKFI